MGCSSSGSKAPEVDAGRRRLSVGQVDASADEKDASDGQQADEDRGMIKTLDEESLMDLLNSADAVGGRKFSLGSGTDTGKTSFANKQQANVGDTQGAMTPMGYTCRKGLKPESPNQDSWVVTVKEGDFAIYGVFDGHGKKGHDVSYFVKENLVKMLVKDSRFKEGNELKELCFDAFKKMQSIISTADQMKKLDAKLSGTTCSIYSTIVLATKKDQAVTAVQITRDHKPDLKDEKARIEKNGGRVVFDGYANHRIYAKNGRYPGLNMSRCLGDLLGHQDCGITCEPETSQRTIDPSFYFLLVCSDGVWEFITPQEAVDIVKKQPPENAPQSADTLAKEAWDKWIKEEGGAVVDDITVVLIYLNQTKN